ncbi:MAG: ABC transporter substrate-binding protein [Actinomycetota bacterium]|nr:ABC transporter substrate-binding protein [Actinomycetota bacterium]
MMKVRSKRAFALILALGLTAAACSDDETTTTAAPTTEAGTDTTEAGTDTTEGTADPLGEPNPADSSLDAYKVGYMWSGVSAAVDNSSDLASAEATVQWINEFGGGIAGGHPLEIVECAGSDAATAAACGSTMVESGVQIVLFNVIGDVATWATPVLAANIPIMAYSSADASLFVAPGRVFTLSNPIAGIGVMPIKLAMKLGVTKSAVVVIDVPGATGPVNAMVPPGFEAAGAGTVDIVPISPTAPDHASAIQVELQNSPGLVHIIGNPAFCSLTIRALKDAAYEGVISMISNCLDGPMKEQLGADLEGIYVSYSSGEDPTNPDVQLLIAILAKYSPDTVPSGTPVGSFLVLEGFHRVMADFEGEFTSDAIAAHIAGHGPVPTPTIDGGTFKCDGTAVPGVAIACTGSFSYAQLDAAGEPTSYEAF